MQLVWGDAPPGPVHVRVGRRGGYVVGAGGPGGSVVEGLRPGTVYDVTIEAEDRVARVRRRTLTPPPGELLCRVATVSDLHLGAERFGLRRRRHDRPVDGEPAALGCARHALAEAVAWSPALIVVKGDLTDHGWHAEWRTAHELLASVPVPVVVATGNHEAGLRREVDPQRPLRARRLAHPDPVHVVDLPGVRVVAVDSTVDATSGGSLRRALPDVLDALADSDRPALVCLHHALDRWPVATKYPAGVPWGEARAALAAIARVRPDALVTSGHTHRNRRRRAGPLVVTEVASTKDHPGVWAGYTVYEGGIVQTVRRTTAPAAMAWTEYTRRVAGGVWGRYAPGRLSDRCFAHVWPR